MKVMSGKAPKIGGCCHHMNVNLDRIPGYFDRVNDVEIV